MEDYFLGGRKLPWYLAGLSMVATTFAADTPLAVTEIVANNGISGNWLWWNLLAGGMLTTFFFARLWRRSGVLTEVELIELRYGGKPAQWLRGLKAVYLGLVMNVLVMGWINLAMISILGTFFGLEREYAILLTAGVMLFSTVYSSLSGLKGVVVTDAFQFVIAMTACIVLAILLVNMDAIGGISGLKEKLPETVFDFFPRIDDQSGGSVLSVSVSVFVAYLGVMWWSSWYPGAEPGGGGYVAQRMMSVKTEKQALGATLFFQMAHYCLRPWPWIITALCTLVLYPGLADPKQGFILSIKDYMPHGLKGLLLVAFLAAYMSSISTQLNWGAGYLVNDFYARFFAKNKDQKSLVKASMFATGLLMLISIIVSNFLYSIKAVWEFLFSCGAGLGLVLILRWYWWRINALAEITATIVPFACYGLIELLKANGVSSPLVLFPNSLYFTVIVTTIAWLVITFATKPESDTVITGFMERVRPMGFWGKWQAQVDNKPLGGAFISWLSAIALAYSLLFLSGKIILQMYDDILVYALVFVCALAVLLYQFRKGKV